MRTMSTTTMDARASAVLRLVAEQAADWHVANREGLDKAGAAAFAEWLKASPLHVQEYLCIAQLAGDLRTASGNPVTSIEALVESARNAPESVESINGPFGDGVAAFPDIGRAARPLAADSAADGAAVGQARAQVAWMRVAATVCAVSLVGLLAVRWLAPGSDVLHRETAHGQHLSHSLPDQSLLTLDADSAVDIRYGKSERHIELVRGQALFQVAHDIARPFRVQAGAVAVTAVGTRFDVDRRADITVVTVLEGTVAVDIAREGAARVMVHAGQQLRIDSELAATGPLAVDASHSAAWLDGQIYFDQEPLAEVAAEVSRYSPQPIEVRDARLRALPISGACAANDTEAFLAFVRSLDGVHVRSEPGSVVVEAR
jgi:transmembrane sensor